MKLSNSQITFFTRRLKKYVRDEMRDLDAGDSIKLWNLKTKAPAKRAKLFAEVEILCGYQAADFDNAIDALYARIAA